MSVNLEELKRIYRNILLTLDRTDRIPEVKVGFYPYVGINNKIRLQENRIEIRISDILHTAPVEIHQALAEILVRKLYRKRVPAKYLEIYRGYIRQGELRERSIETRKRRGRKVLNGSQGQNYDLDEIFDLINQIYFQSVIPKPRLTWSAQRTYRILGHHDSTHETIVISKSLDDLRVPRFVVEYVVYHEMLHIKHPTQIQNGRRAIHTPAFRRDERDFAFFSDAEEWIEKNAGKLKKNAKK
jgi:hypothetical protein